MKNKEKVINAFARLLYNLKWIGVVITAICGLLFIEGATDAEGITSSEEGVMYSFWISLFITLLLFIYHNRWIACSNKIIKSINDIYNK